ncbi:MAG: hypothetical protein Kow00121_49580 [Elainellaceae cyanobacterium]
MMTMQQQLLALVTMQFGLQWVEQRSPLVVAQSPSASSEHLMAQLEGNIGFIFPYTNEQTRAGMIVSPILLHLALSYQLSLYSGSDFNADIPSGLSGTVDHLLSRAMTQGATIIPPIVAVVETKSRERGVSHCLVQMVAAQQVNACPDPVYGVVTNGLLWRFLKLEGTTVTIDLTEYPLLSPHSPFASLALNLVECPATPIEPLLCLLVPMLRAKGALDTSCL